MTIAGTCALLLAAALNAGPAGQGGEAAMSGRPIEEVLRAHTGELMSLPGVVGTALGSCAGRPCIKVYLDGQERGLAARIPPTIEGFPVEVVGTGPLRPLRNGE